MGIIRRKEFLHAGDNHCLIVLGAIAGWIAGLLVGGDEGLGVIGHIVLGIIGAFVGGFLAQIMGLSPGPAGGGDVINW